MRSPRMTVTKWKALAPTVHAWAGLDKDARITALGVARAHPDSALRCYEAIVRSLVRR